MAKTSTQLTTPSKQVTGGSTARRSDGPNVLPWIGLLGLLLVANLVATVVYGNAGPTHSVTAGGTVKSDDTKLTDALVRTDELTNQVQDLRNLADRNESEIQQLRAEIRSVIASNAANMGYGPSLPPPPGPIEQYNLEPQPLPADAAPVPESPTE